MDLERPRSIQFDLDALAHNYRKIRALVGPDIRIIPALKANAYGHGIGPVARTLAGLDIEMFATGSLDDAEAIRAAGVTQPVLMFAGVLPAGIARLLERGFVPTVHDDAGAAVASEWGHGSTRVFVKVEGGHGRLGVPMDEALRFITRLARLDGLEIGGVYTHFAFFDATGRAWVEERLRMFDDLLDALAREGVEVPITQALASSPLVGGLQSSASAVSPGSALFGISAAAPDVVDMSEYHPVLHRISSRVIHVGSDRGVPWVGVIPLGLIDGYRDVAPGQTAHALVAGEPVPIRSVSLEHISLELEGRRGIRVGDEVLLLGRSGDHEITLSDLSVWSGARPTHVLMSLSGRIPATYLPDTTPA